MEAARFVFAPCSAIYLLVPLCLSRLLLGKKELEFLKIILRSVLETLSQELAFTGYYLIKYNSLLSCLLTIIPSMLKLSGVSLKVIFPLNLHLTYATQ